MSAQQVPLHCRAASTARHPSSESWESPVASPKLLGDRKWSRSREIRSAKSVSDSYLHSADFAVSPDMKQVISATEKLRISYGVRSLFAARQVRHMHMFRRFPAMKKRVRISGCFHGWPHQIPTAGRAQGFGMDLLTRQWQTETRICSVSAVAEVAVTLATKTTFLATGNLPLSYGLCRLYPAAVSGRTPGFGLRPPHPHPAQRSHVAFDPSSARIQSTFHPTDEMPTRRMPWPPVTN